MVESPVGYLCQTLVALKEIQEQWAIYPSAHFSGLGEPEKRKFLLALEQLKDTTSDLGLDACNDRIHRLEPRIRLDPAVSTLRTEIRFLLEVAEDQLQRRHFFFIPTEKIKYNAESEKLFGLTWERFEDAQTDMLQSGRCYALAQYSACVFHCMNVLERGLRSLAQTSEVNVSFKAEIEVENWKNIIDSIEAAIRKEIKRIDQEESRSLEKLDKLKRYAESAMQFRYFKDAWRNHIAHGRDQYDEHQAETILKHTIDFMTYLADAGLKGETG